MHVEDSLKRLEWGPSFLLVIPIPPTVFTDGQEQRRVFKESSDIHTAWKQPFFPQSGLLKGGRVTQVLRSHEGVTQGSMSCYDSFSN